MLLLYKMKSIFILIFFSLNLIVIKKIKSQIILPLEYLENHHYKVLSNNNINIIQRIYYNTLITRLEIGKPSQNILLFIDMSIDDFYLKTFNYLNNSISDIEILDSQHIYQFKKNNFYNEPLSQSYKEVDCKPVNNYSGICLSKDLINLYNQTNIIHNEFLIKITKNSQENIPGFLGLLYNKNIYSNLFKNLITQLKEQNITNNYYWFFNIEKFTIFEIKGKLVFGGLPHQIFPNKYSEEDLRFTNAKIITNIYRSWRIEFNKIYIDSIKKNYNLRDTIITLNSRIYNIIGTYEFNQLIKTLFMDKLIKEKKCFISNFSQNIYSYDNLSFYYCDISVKDILYEEISSIKFFLAEFDFIFEITKEEIFYIKDNYIYLMIVFQNNKYNYWIVGQMFILKYNFVFNADTKVIGLYKKVNNITINDNDYDNDNDNDNDNITNSYIVPKNNIYLIIIIIITCLCFLCF